MTAYEVSISKLAAYENAENFDPDDEFNILGYGGEYKSEAYLEQ